MRSALALPSAKTDTAGAGFADAAGNAAGSGITALSGDGEGTGDEVFISTDEVDGAGLQPAISSQTKKKAKNPAKRERATLSVGITMGNY